MGTLLQAWLLFPAVLLALSLGCGLLLERLAGRPLPGALIVPLGLATIFVLARLATMADATAELATPLVVVVAIVGLVLGRRRLRPRAVDRWVAGAALATFAAYAAPVVLAGEAGFLGYTVLGDTAVHFVLMDRLATHGTDLAGLAPSSYRTTLESYYASGYPLGAHAALAATRPLAFADVSHLFQPFLCAMLAALALTAAALVRGLVRPAWRTALVCVVAAQPAIVYSYAAQGSIKELATLWLVALLASVLGWMWGLPRRPADPGEEEFRFRLGHVVPLAVTAAAGVGAIGLAVLAWLGPVALIALVAVVRNDRRRPARVVALGAGFAALVAVLSLPTLLDSGRYLEGARAAVTSQVELGNLFEPLGLEHVLGVWLSGDYRVGPRELAGLGADDLQMLLLVLVAAAAAVGLVFLVVRRAVGPLTFVVSSLVALAYITRDGSPWADAKAITIAAPAVVLAAALAPPALERLAERRPPRLRLPLRVVAGAIAGALGVGIAASNAFVYHDASLAPTNRLDELAEAGERAEGQGPLLYTEFEEFGKHFLRDADPVGAAEAFAVPGLTPELRAGGMAPFGVGTVPAALDPGDLARFGSIVARRSPAGTRPPGRWRLAWRGRSYDLWQRGGDARGSVCPEPPATMRVTGRTPPAWGLRSERPRVFALSGPGVVRGTVDVRVPGRRAIWLLGSFGRGVSASIDGRSVGEASNELTQPYGWVRLGVVRLDRGAHRIRLERGGGTLAPGSGDGPRTLGPLALSAPGC